ncbi:class 3 adenyl cyclase-like protein [Encephalitozoon romaleae SJ-2008]|uniref:Class 3 adenyl cyclase-like protein n=1 Tax=Encephalitozoon romaleae (strain SJ-2008) TaxID=1178016 RepID=I6ZJ04_ENCRO|nr:class 3 adenyl cyclase-like protein [Encephalitozoon romaleae SJ-2008]AFN83183.1 class 3 adenyl cyclase-like protein [Encephalitozoon romaleae SJ-2008]
MWSNSMILMLQLMGYAIKMNTQMIVYIIHVVVNPVRAFGSVFCGFKVGIVDGVRCMLVPRSKEKESQEARKAILLPKNMEVLSDNLCYKKYIPQKIHKRFLQGDLVLVITDIVDSTSLWNCFPDAMHRTIEVHDEVARGLCKAYGGLEVRNEGDSFFLVFTDIRNALDFSIRFYREIECISFNFRHAFTKRVREGKETEFLPLKIRMAMNKGPIMLCHNKFLEIYGDAVTKTFGMLSHSNGKICISQNCLEPGNSWNRRKRLFCIHK